MLVKGPFDLWQSPKKIEDKLYTGDKDKFAVVGFERIAVVGF